MPGLIRWQKSSDRDQSKGHLLSSESRSTGSRGKSSPSELMKEHEAEASTPLLPKAASMSCGITYIPPQQDPLAGSTVLTACESPVQLCLWDLGLLTKMIPSLHNIFIPSATQDQSSELYPDWRGVRDVILQAWLGISGVIFLLLGPLVILVLPGLVTLLLGVLICLGTWLVTLPLQGSRIVYSTMDESTRASAKDHQDERWLFINGVDTGHRSIQLNIDRLAKTFGRPVIGVHNNTYGLIADLLECVIQRCMSLSTRDVRVAFDYVKSCLADPTVKKVVLIGHSQGGIIVSMVLDQLFADLPSDNVAKLEVYTFGSAANHFNNPLISLPGYDPNDTDTETRRKHSIHIIPHIEHYVNGLDPIPAWGILHNVRRLPANRFAGSVFIRDGATGHYFNQHYLDYMFPLDHAQACAFLDQVVMVDHKTADQRERASRGRLLPKAPAGDGGKRTDITSSHVENVPAVSALALRSSANALLEARRGNLTENPEGKTVRQLSRLWKYVDGGTPRPERTVPA